MALSKPEQVALPRRNYWLSISGSSGSVWPAYAQGFTSYNLATSGQWIVDSFAVIKEALKTQNPKVLILGSNTMYEPVPSKIYEFAEYLPLFIYHEFFFNTTLEKGTIDKDKGANLSKVINAYTGSSDYMNKQTDLQTINETALQYLQRIKQLCNEKGILMIIVSAPSSKNWTEGKHRAIQQWCDQNDVSFVDYNEPEKQQEISFDWSTDTRDKGDHVNITGSIKVCRDLGTYLSSLKILPDHRGDSSYQEWEEDYENSQYYQ
jgi:hypothetical protein